MKHDHLHDADNDFRVEITSLDMPEAPVNAPVSFMRIPRIRTWLTIVSVITGLILVAVVLSTVLPSLLPPAQRHTAPAAPTVYSLNTEVIHGVAYVISSDKVLHALRISNGSQLWQLKLPITPVVSVNILKDVNNTDNTLYLRYTDESGVFIQALSTEDGALLWTSNPFPFDSNLIVVNNSVSYLLTSPVVQGHTLIALNDKNGSVLWKYTFNVPIILGPAGSLQINMNKIYVNALLTTGKQTLFALSSNNGSLLWHYDDPNVQPANNSDSVFMQNGLMYIIGNNGSIKALRAENGREAWSYINIHNEGNIEVDASIVTSIEGGALKVLRASDGVFLWRYKNSVGVFNILSVTDGVVYVSANDGSIVALRINGGTKLWQARPAFPSFVPSSLSVVDGTVYVPAITSLVTQEITLYALRTSDGALLWQHDMGASDTDIQQVSNGLIFASVGNFTFMKVLRARDGAQLWQSPISAPLSQDIGSFAIVGGVMLLRSSSGMLEAHQASSGAVLWRYPHLS